MAHTPVDEEELIGKVRHGLKLTPVATPSASRRGSGVISTPSGSTVAFHSRTADERDAQLPHATKKALSDHLDNKYTKLFTLTPSRMRMIVDAFEETLDKGLQEWGQVVPMFPTWVFGTPTGSETGDYLALDLGGTNLRVCLVSLLGGCKFEITQTKYRLTEEQKQEDGAVLFDFCAKCVKEFIDTHLPHVTHEKPIVVGFTFSYPCLQDKIDHGILIRWTKGFGAPNVENHDVAEMFRKALEHHKVPAIMSALINDTTGALIASQYVRPHTKIAVILGTGCNAAYSEDISCIGKLKDKNLDPTDTVAINCEWGAFDSDFHQHLPRTKYDIHIDEHSNKPGEQAFEKMISGRYLGEIFRLVIMELIDEGVMFLGQNTYKIEKAYSLDTAFLSLMESDPTDELLTIIGIFTHFYGLETTLEERQFFRSLARLVGRRAARLSACGIAAIVRKKGYVEEGCEVGADGTLYNKYPGFAQRIHQGLVDVFGEKGKNIVTHHAEDGSGVGAAIIAAMTKARKDAGKYADL
ncbi:hexokinase A [Serendipita sp. 411]|nr:hexokinase A [Serendipita sp. 411]KAG8857913.1 hexokinase A [Serendipita sp. 405]